MTWYLKILLSASAIPLLRSCVGSVELDMEAWNLGAFPKIYCYLRSFPVVSTGFGRQDEVDWHFEAFGRSHVCNMFSAFLERFFGCCMKQSRSGVHQFRGNLIQVTAGYKAICVDREILEVLVFANNSWEKSCCSIRKVIMRYYDYLAVADLLDGTHNV